MCTYVCVCKFITYTCWFYVKGARFWQKIWNSFEKFVCLTTTCSKICSNWSHGLDSLTLLVFSLNFHEKKLGNLKKKQIPFKWAGSTSKFDLPFESCLLSFFSFSKSLLFFLFLFLCFFLLVLFCSLACSIHSLVESFIVSVCLFTNRYYQFAALSLSLSLNRFLSSFINIRSIAYSLDSFCHHHHSHKCYAHTPTF